MSVLAKIIVSQRERIDFLKKHDTKQYRDSLIDNDEMRFLYCKYIEDREEVWSGIATDRWIVDYCVAIKDRKEMWLKLTEPGWIHVYISNCGSRPELQEVLRKHVANANSL